MKYKASDAGDAAVLVYVPTEFFAGDLSEAIPPEARAMLTKQGVLSNQQAARDSERFTPQVQEEPKPPAAKR